MNIFNVLVFLLFSNLIFLKLPLVYSFITLYSNVKKRNEIISYKDIDQLYQLSKLYPKKLWFCFLIPILGDIWFFIMGISQHKMLNSIKGSTFGGLIGFGFSLRHYKMKMWLVALAGLIYQLIILSYIYYIPLQPKGYDYSHLILIKYTAQVVFIIFGSWLFTTNIVLKANLKAEMKALLKQHE